ncbi:PqqD family protein [Mucilaginibacter sp. Bleaf8]|uniref:PqqD family peptide modification chaperone n=1 Tax=Mucilaginibacter sp. Bleaf8 TaxID=2834430 RepID=UPI001BD0DF5C|nr:PqqD family peptide modification chaperone [Mucilaginibacter sp. Bleaf8]MBS7563855.1 PqqD family protein [Mucilaginibacter sp. Bleaf8]
MITLQSLITRNETEFVVSELGNDLVMMNTKSGSYIGLNEVSADIWRQLEHPAKATQIISHLQSLYEVSEDVCETETLECLNAMLKQGLIRYN